MEHLLNSRLSRDQSPTKLENLSPEKFGKAAFASLSFTPSKLVDNVLYKEVTTLKKIEEQCSKVRQSEAINSILKDRLSQIQEERDGIQSTLTQQIAMYKKMLNQNEAKHEQRIKDIQKSFNEEMQRLILAKEEEAKYSQSEKQLLQGKIQDLQSEVARLKDRLDHGGSNFDELTRSHQKLEIHYKNVCQKLQQTEKRLKDDGEKAKADYQELSRKLYNAEIEFKGQVDKIQLQREREKENLERLHRVELQKTENKRIQEAMIKNQELKDLAATFEAQANRLNDIINSKQRSIDHLSVLLNDQKEKMIEMTKNCTAQITNLVNQKNRLKEEVHDLNYDLALFKQDRKNFEMGSDKTVATLQSIIEKLKDDLELNQVNFVRQKDKTAFVIEDLHREMVAIKSENERAGMLSHENSMLCKQIRNLKNLLLQSSLEMQKCKEEFLRIGRENNNLAVKVQELGFQNQNLMRIKFQREEEARGWRQSYYLSRR